MCIITWKYIQIRAGFLVITKVTVLDFLQFELIIYAEKEPTANQLVLNDLE